MIFLNSEQLESPDWLRSLRWVALIGMASSIAGAHFFGAELPTTLLFGLLAALALLNLFWPRLERYMGTLRIFIFLQLIVDLFFLTTLLWWSGGLVNPFVSFYLFHVCIAGLLLDFWLTAGISALAILFVLILTQAPGLVFRGEELVLTQSPIWVGIPLGLVLLICVITAFIFSFMARLRRAQAELRRRGRMEALGTLAGGLGHELGTPLNSILVLAKDLEQNESLEAASAFKTIRLQAERCGKLVKLLVGFGSGGKTSADWSKINTKSWLEELFNSALPKSSKVKLQLHVDGSVNEVFVPEIPLRQALINVFQNAEQAMRQQEHALLLVHCFHNGETGEFCVSVHDNGPGFSPEARERAFDPFFTTKAPGDGTGLGLYISYYLLEQIGGTIQIEEAAYGASVVIKIPERAYGS